MICTYSYVTGEKLRCSYSIPYSTIVLYGTVCAPGAERFAKISGRGKSLRGVPYLSAHLNDSPTPPPLLLPCFSDSGTLSWALCPVGGISIRCVCVGYTGTSRVTVPEQLSLGGGMKWNCDLSFEIGWPWKEGLT